MERWQWLDKLKYRLSEPNNAHCSILFNSPQITVVRHTINNNHGQDRREIDIVIEQYGIQVRCENIKVLPLATSLEETIDWQAGGNDASTA